MSRLRCCVIDDEPLAARLIASYVERTPFLSLDGVYNSASDAVRPILDGGIDLVFLDIEMPQLGGMEFARIIPPSCRIVFTTAYDRYAVEGFRVNAVDYLLKPVSYDEFLEAASRALRAISPAATTAEAPTAPTEATQQAAREFIIVKSEYRLVQIRVADIIMVEGLKDYIKIYVEGLSKPVLTLMSMKAIEQVLPATQFLRVHRSYIVNTQRISIIERNHIVIGNHSVPVSETYRQNFNDYISSLNPDD